MTYHTEAEYKGWQVWFWPSRRLHKAAVGKDGQIWRFFETWQEARGWVDLVQSRGVRAVQSAEVQR